MILAIGNELLNGEVLETNSSYLQQELSDHSLSVQKVSVVPDDMELIQLEIRAGIEKYPFLFIMGGLGPTEDDLTRYAVGKAVNRELSQSMEEMEVLKGKFAHFQRAMSPNNERQTFFPEKAMILSNPIGTASGFHLTENGCHLFVLPGVPSEMKNIFQHKIVPLLKKEIPEGRKPRKLLVKVIGFGESVLDEIIKKKIAPYHPVKWEIIAKGEGVFVKFYSLDVSSQEENDDEWKKLLKKSLTEHIGHRIFGYDHEEMGEIVADLLRENKLKLGCMESCTGGAVAKYLTDFPGSSRYFLGGLVTYSNELKIRLANVNPELLDQYGAVSEEVAQAMAIGGKKALGSDLCLSITGIAGPEGGLPEKPVGTVWFGVEDHQGWLTTKKRIFNGDREDIRRKSLFYGLNLIRLALIKT